MRRAILVLLSLAGLCAAAQAKELAGPAEPKLRALWTATAGEAAGPHTLALADGALLAVSFDGALFAFEPETGRQLWRKAPPEAGAVESVQIATEGPVVVAAWPKARELVAYTAATGAVRWRQPLPAPVGSLVGCAAHQAVVATFRGASTLQAKAVDPASGRPLWQTAVGGHLMGAGGGRVFAGVRSDTGMLLKGLEALDCADGARHPLPVGPRPFQSLVAAADETVFTWHFEYGFQDGVLCATDPAQADGPRCGPAPEGLNGGEVVAGQLLLATGALEAHPLRKAGPPVGDAAWRTPGGRAHLAPLPAGGQILVGFGATGAADSARLLDPVTGDSLGRLDLKKAPTALAADARRAYVGSYDGKLTAFALVRPGAAPVRRAPVTPQAAPPALAVAAPPPLPWRSFTTLDAHPKRARSSGNDGPGRARPVAFVDADRLAIGGNDDRVRVVDLRQGKQLWISKSLGKDVEGLSVSATGRLAARIYGGDAHIFEPKGDTWRPLKVLRAGHGWMSGLTGSGAWYIHDDFNGQLSWLDPASGKAKASVEVAKRMDRRGLRVQGRWLVVPQADSLQVLDTDDLREGPSAVHTIPAPLQTAEGTLIQAFMVRDDLLLTERCAPTACEVTLQPLPGGPTQTLRFDTTGAGWVPQVPSALDISPDGAWLFFFRLGLAPLLVRVADDARQPLAAVTGQTPGEYTVARFSPDGRRLALGMFPEPHQVTILEQTAP